MNMLDRIRQKQAGAAPAGVREQPKAAKVRFRCGHETPIAEFANRDCPPCREKASQAKAAKKRAERAAKLAGQPVPGRLPDGAEYRKVFDAAAVLWTVTLAIPGTPGFSATGSGSLRTERAVDRLYREWVKGQEQGRVEG